MNTAIIAEYNPFHKGHLYHINKTKEMGSHNIIAIMSGNYTQRGEPALSDKHIRTKACLANGVDMVLELPVEYATGGADVFAFGSCDIIKKSNIIDSISFGCENDNIYDLVKVAKLLKNESKQFKAVLKNELNNGLSYPAAREKAITACINIDTNFLSSSNNILAIEYLKNIVDTDIKPLAIKRIVSQYNDVNLTGEISSASAIRHNLSQNNSDALKSIPQNIQHLFDIDAVPDIDDYTDIFHYIVRTEGKDICKYADVTEGLENRIIALCNKGLKLSELIEEVKTKRYTYSKIKRAFLHIILKIKKEDQDIGVKYIRVLGVKKDKIHLLSELSQKAQVPVITNVSDNRNVMSKEILATDIYNLKGQIGLEYTKPIVII